MISLLQKILCAIENLAYKFADLLVSLVNLFIAGLGAVALAVLSLLPGFPDPPEGDPAALEYANWFFPISKLVALLTAVALLYLGFLLVRTILNWVKAL